MRFKTFYIGLVSAMLLAANANAAIILDLVLDPATTAGNGIAAVNGFTVTSTQSGAGRYQLFALDTTDGSFGISSYNIALTGTATNLHRSPTTSWNDADENGPFNAGFSLLRSSNNNGGIFQASQPLPGSVPALITGFGQTTSDFQTKIPAAAPGTFALTTSGQWGNYATDPSAGSTGKSWVLIGEGTYAGAAPTISSAAVVTYFNQDFQSLVGNVCIGAANCLTTVNPPVANDLALLGLDTKVTPTAVGQVTATGDAPITFGDLTFVSYTEGFNGVNDGMNGAGAALGTDGQFSFPIQGRARGTYLFSYSATNGGGSDTGSITVEVTQVPEPSTLALFGLAMVGGLGMFRRRNG